MRNQPTKQTCGSKRSDSVRKTDQPPSHQLDHVRLRPELRKTHYDQCPGPQGSTRTGNAGATLSSTTTVPGGYLRRVAIGAGSVTAAPFAPIERQSVANGSEHESKRVVCSGWYS
ncbi:hypothetical protein HUJ05_003280 [Dendroctonus ponderosae]|nr:hypothetical protein HUJ05_003280 [Dendroctonus ponderosae]